MYLTAKQETHDFLMVSGLFNTGVVYLWNSLRKYLKLCKGSVNFKKNLKAKMPDEYLKQKWSVTCTFQFTLFSLYFYCIYILYCSLKTHFFGSVQQNFIVSVMYFVFPPHKILGCQYPCLPVLASDLFWQCRIFVPSFHSLRMDWRPKRLKSLGLWFL